MAMDMELPYTPSLQALLLSLLPLLAVFYLAKNHFISKHSHAARRLPPSPPGLPLIGNLHQVGALPHRALAALAAAHGGGAGLMLLRLGQVPTLVVSSSDMAGEFMRAHDHVFATRPFFRTAEILSYGFQGVVFAPYGDHWRHVRKLCTVHVFSSRRAQGYNAIREQEVAFLVRKIKNHSAPSPIDMSQVLHHFANDVICRAVSGKSSRGAGRNDLFRELIEENTALLGGFRLEDYFPALRCADWLLGTSARARKNFARWDELMETVVEEHRRRRRCRREETEAGDGEEEEEERDFVDVLLSLQSDAQVDFELSSDIVKSILVDMFAAGTDTTHIVLEWALSELVRNPATMAKLQDEVRGAGAAGRMAKTEELAATPYLKAVVKETLRLHPPVPLLVPRECMQDCTVAGFDVARGTRVIVNAWAIGREPASWEAPGEFRPERFLAGGGGGGEVDFRGSDFQFIPFGAGRRVCPGMQFGLATVELALANLVRLFDWGLPGGAAAAELDMAEGPGLTAPRKTSLLLVAKPFGTGNGMDGEID